MTSTEFTGRATIRLHHGDCMDALAAMQENQYELAIVDIPYGLGDKLTSGGTWAAKYNKSDSEWDKLPPKEYFLELQRSTNEQIIWGGNYAHGFLQSNRHFVIWDKVSHMPTMADCEYAWTSLDSNAKIFKHPRNESTKRIHITQKPVALYKWLLKNYAKEGDTILDTHGGSMSIAIACWDMGFDLDLWELDDDYYAAGVERVQKHVNQLQFAF